MALNEVKHMTSVTLELEDELLELLGQQNQPLPRVAREILILELYRRSIVSSGKAAELLGVSRQELIQRASELGIPYFRFTNDDWKAEVAESERI